MKTLTYNVIWNSRLTIFKLMGIRLKSICIFNELPLNILAPLDGFGLYFVISSS